MIYWFQNKVQHPLILCKVKKDLNNWVRDSLNPVYTIRGHNTYKDNTANGYRLLTKEEWIFCAKDGENFTLSGSNHLDDVGWYSKNSGLKTKPVGNKTENGYGLQWYDW